jgi:hypothetical protein
MIIWRRREEEEIKAKIASTIFKELFAAGALAFRRFLFLDIVS